MWQIKTSSRVYAVKVLNPEIMRRPNILTEYLESERIAKEASDAGIPAITALNTNNGSVFKFDDQYLIVYPWVEGKTLTDEEASPEQTETIGRLLAKIHQLNLKLAKSETPEINKTTREYWKNIFNTVSSKDSHLKESEIENILQLADKIEEFKAQLHQLDIKMVVSHCDLDKKNVLWKDENTPVIIDWESVGFVNPGVELMIVAQDWSDMKKDKYNPELFKAVISGYKNAGGKITDTSEIIFYASIEATLNWLEYNLRRSHEDQFNDEEKQLGKREVEKTMRELMFLNKHKEELLKLFSEIS